jgi:hypothetical protein
MVEGLFLDGVHAEPAGTPISRQYDLVIVTGAHEAKPLLAFVQLAIAGTDIALDAAVVQGVPVPRREKGDGRG